MSFLDESLLSFFFVVVFLFFGVGVLEKPFPGVFLSPASGSFRSSLPALDLTPCFVGVFFPSSRPFPSTSNHEKKSNKLPMLSVKQHHLAAETGQFSGRTSAAFPAGCEYLAYRCRNMTYHEKKSNKTSMLSRKQHHLAAEIGQLSGQNSSASPARWEHPAY